MPKVLYSFKLDRELLARLKDAAEVRQTSVSSLLVSGAVAVLGGPLAAGLEVAAPVRSRAPAGSRSRSRAPAPDAGLSPLCVCGHRQAAHRRGDLVGRCDRCICRAFRRAG